MDVVAVREAARDAVAHARRGDGPYVLEMKTYRYRGHSMSDPAKYRTREEVDDVREHNDPLKKCEQRIFDGGFADEAALKEIDKEIKQFEADFSMNPDRRELAGLEVERLNLQKQVVDIETKQESFGLYIFLV